MKKIIITYGTIASAIIAIWVVALAFLDNCTDEYGMLYGYSAMLLCFSMIFVAGKKFRNENGGAITFGKAFKIGLGITLIASTVYVLVWLVEYYFFIPDFFDRYAAKTIEHLTAEGAPTSVIASAKTDMEQMKELCENPFFNALMTYTEILPVGILVSLITALILKSKPAAETQS